MARRQSSAVKVCQGLKVQSKLGFSSFQLPAGSKIWCLVRRCHKNHFLHHFCVKANEVRFGDDEICVSRLPNGLHGASPWPGSVQFEGLRAADLVLTAKRCSSVVPGSVPGPRNEPHSAISLSLCVAFIRFSWVAFIWFWRLSQLHCHPSPRCDAPIISY